MNGALELEKFDYFSNHMFFMLAFKSFLETDIWLIIWRIQFRWGIIFEEIIFSKDKRVWEGKIVQKLS